MNTDKYYSKHINSGFYFVFSLFVLLLCDNVFSQPYYYYSKMRDTVVVSDIFRINFKNSNHELFLEEAGRINQLYWNSDQTNLIIKQRFTVVDVIKLDSSNKFQRISENIESIVNILDAPKTNRLLVEVGDLDGIYKNTIIFNRTTFESLDTIIFDSQGDTFLSEEENVLYGQNYDKKGIFFSAVDIINNSILYDNEQCSSLGESPYYYVIEKGRKGWALIFFRDGEDESYERQNFVVCKPDSDINFSPVSIPFRSKGYLSIDANYVIIEKVDWVEESYEAEHHTGEIQIYNASTGSKIAELSLTPNGEVMFFKNFPDMFFYFNRADLSVVPINLSTIANNEEFLKVKLKDSQGNFILNGSLQYYDSGWKDAVSNGDGTFTVITNQNNVSLRMTYGYAQQTVNNISAHNNSYTFQTVSANVQLRNSQGSLIDTGTVQYYAGAWRTFGTTTNGVAIKELLPINYSFRMAYEFASIDKQQNLAVDPTVVFQTVNATVQLKNSSGNLIDAGTVQYYSGAWRTFGTTTNGVANKELLPINYSFRMAYEFASIDKQQNLSVDPTVVFQTVNAAVQLKNSSGNLIDAGSVQYYSGAWRNFGTTTNGVANKELLPINYSFRMAYEFASVDKQQNLSIDPTVVFQTVNATVQLKNSLGNLIDAGTVQYYSGAWRNFGTTTNGVATKELLPINYSFRMAYEFASIDKQQNLAVDPTVVFQTVNATVQLKNSSGNLIDAGTVQYYSGAWRTFGTTTNGVSTKELLPINYSFRMTYEYVSNDKQQNLNTNPVVNFATVLCSVKVSNATNQPLNNANVKYYSGTWRNLGITNAEGITIKELLPANLSFRANAGSVSKDKQQDITSNNLVEINLNTP